MHKLYISVLLLFLVQAAASQRPVLQWAKAFNEDSRNNYRDYNNGRTIGVDQQGNVYTAGLFQNTIDFDPGPGVYNITAGSPNGYGIYISKLDANGNFVWAKQIPVLVEFGDIELKVDKSGNVYLASDLHDAADMDPGPGVLMMKPIGAKDAFVIKLDSDGNLVWAKQFGGPGDTVPQANTLDIDQDNNVIICGLFNNTVDFDPGPGTHNLTSSFHFQSYIAKLNNNGDFIWALQFAGPSFTDVKCDAQNNIYTTGGFGGTCDFDPGPAVYNLVGNSLEDGFVFKLDAKGNFVWAKSVGNAAYTNNSYMQSRGIDIDGMNNIVVTGAFFGKYDFDPGSEVHDLSSNNGSYDCFILKLNDQGGFLWAKIIGNKEMDGGNDVAVDNENNVYVVGEFGPSVDFDPGPGDYIINSPYYGASVLVKLNPDGNFMYAAPFQTLNYGGSLFRRMFVDASMNIYITGAFGSMEDFDPGPNVFPLTSSSDESPFVLKLGRCTNITTSTLNISTCNNFILNNETFDSSGNYKRIIANASGCDSIITLNLTINKKYTQQTKSICEGDIFFAGGASQNTSGTFRDTLHTVQGCDSIVTTYLTVHPKPLLDLGPDRDLCNNAQLTISPGSFTSYQWQDRSNGSSCMVKVPGIYWVKVTDEFNCTATDTFTVHSILPAPANFLKEKDSICSYESLAVLSVNAYSNYLWSTGATERKIMVQKPGVYWLTVKDANGCSGTDSVTVFPKDCMWGVYLPTSFTPNGDGKNDHFKALVFGKPLSFKLQVFDRSGQVVFKTTDPNAYWDGHSKGLNYSTQVFVWLCSYQLEGRQPEIQKGTVTLIQ